MYVQAGINPMKKTLQYLLALFVLLGALALFAFAQMVFRDVFYGESGSASTGNATSENNTSNTADTGSTHNTNTENTSDSTVNNGEISQGGTSQVLPVPALSDRVSLLDYSKIEINNFYSTTPLLLTVEGQVVSKLIGMDEVLITYGTLLKLEQADIQLREQGYHIQVFCAYRDEEMQAKLRQHYENTTGDIGKGTSYVALPGKSLHQTGQAVDLTIVSASGEVYAPTPYLEFSPNVAVANIEPSEPLALMQKILKDNGFVSYHGEWWHFTDNTIYPVN